MALVLSVPAAIQNSPKGLETRPKHAKAWIESLPLTKTLQSGRQVCDHLGALNRARIPADERLELMEIYHPVLATLLDELEHVFGYSPLPLPTKQREAFDLAHNLANECAYGYKHCILEKTNKLIAFGTRKALPLPIYRTMGLLRQLLVQSYKTYYPVAVGIWQEMNQLYAYCEEQAMLAETPDPEMNASIQDLYMDAVLLSLADPYRLMQREADKVLDLLAQNRGLAALGPKPPDDTDPNRTFIVALDSDRAPRLLSNALKDPAGQVLRALDIGRLLERLKQRPQTQAGRSEVPAKSRTTHDATDLIGRLARLWGDPPKRQFRRNSAETSVALCSGIKAIAYFAELGEKEEPPVEAASIRSGTTLPLLKIPTDPISRQVGVEEWIVLNQSANGLRLHREPGGNGGITVGEAIGVRFIGGRGWNIGVVRWLNMLENNDLEFGLELISPSAHPIQIEPTIASNGRAQAALQLPSMIQDDETESLLTFPDTFSDLREFELDDGGESRLVRATTLVEKTSRFDLFQFTPS
jgi:hypothetical protein